MNGISSPDARRRIIVCPPRKSCILKVLRQLKGKTFRWVYLGENVTQFIFIERLMGAAGERIEIGGRLQEIAQSLRQPYIDYIGKLSITNNSLLWWASCLSDKNPWFSKTFLYACYVKLCQAIVNLSGEENLVLVGENKAIREGIAENIKSLPHYEIQHINTPVRDSVVIFDDTFKSIRSKVYFFFLTIYKMTLARRYRLKLIPNSQTRERGGLVVLHNWVDARSFSDKGEYRDSYFGQLARHLSRKGKNVVIIPHILYTVKYLKIYRKTLKKLEQSLGNFLLPESFLTLSDVLRVYRKTLPNSQEKWIYPVFEGIHLAGIISADLRTYRERTDLTYNLLLYEAIKRWRQAGIPIESFIYPYESQTWEKACCLALRKYYPTTKIIGYQHATVPGMLLNYFFSKEELPVLPFPDKVITTGKYTEKLFKESGYDPAKVICGGAIRYIGLMNKKSLPARKDITKPIILVTPSIDINETVELVRKVIKAFGDKKQYKIVLKFHPDRPYGVVAKGIGSLPEYFIVSDKPIGDLLPESNLLLYSSSATSIEAIALGVPILHIKSDFTIDRDNLADFPASVRESVSTPDEIVNAVENIFQMDEKELTRKRKVWSDVVAEMFGPVDESTFDLFL